MATGQEVLEPDAALHSDGAFLWLQTVALETNLSSPLFTSTDEMTELWCYHSLISFLFGGLRACFMCFFLSVQELHPQTFPDDSVGMGGSGPQAGDRKRKLGL